MTRKRISPEINALSTVLFAVVMVLLIVVNTRQAREKRTVDQGEEEAA